ncbi:MAG TPA: hypothetical protein VGM10_04140 [Actinocrinis sp.]|jgi:hypothetical protein
MEEAEFWGRLEYRICAEFSGFDDHLRWYWCDGLDPERYERHGEHWHISGRTWVGTRNTPRLGQRQGRQQAPWRFTLIVRHAGERDGINWDDLVPSDGLTGWLGSDPDNRSLRIDPGAGHFD